MQMNSDQDGAGRNPARVASFRHSRRSHCAVKALDSRVGLISPPPHHDIYSIEDLAQLITI